MKIRTAATILIFGILLLAPFMSSAATQPPIWPKGFWPTKGLISCTGAGVGGSASKTCTSLDDLIQTVLNFISFGETLVLFVFAPIFFAWGGITILTSGGSPEKVGQGKKMLTGTVVGIVLVLAAYLIISTFLQIFGVTGVGGFPNP